MAGGAVAVLGVHAARSDSPPVLEAAPASSPTPPSTVPPNTPRPAPTPPSSAEVDQRAERPTRDGQARDRRDRRDGVSERSDRAEAVARPGGTSELAGLLGPSWSAIPPEIEPRPVPVGMQISSIDVARYPIRPVGLEPDGQLEIPDETEIGWYLHGATAGEEGSTVLAAHVSWNGTTGPFARLGAVEPGDQIELRLDDETVRHYEVVERAMYGKLALPADRIWRRSGPEGLVLITCGGEFNPAIRRYTENIVVYAVPVG